MKTKNEIVDKWLPRYTGTAIENFGEYILITNFGNYVEMSLVNIERARTAITRESAKFPP